AELEGLSNHRFETLYLDENKLQDLHALKDMTSLKELTLETNALNENALVVIGQLPELQDAVISDNEFPGRALKHLYGMHNLKSLRVIDCPNVTAGDVNKLREALPGALILAKSLEKSVPETAYQLLLQENSLSMHGNLDEADQKFDEAMK